MIQIGKNIRKIRELKNISRKHVSDKIGTSLKTYSNIENDLTSPDISTLEKIANVLEISISKIFNFDENVILNNHGHHVENFSNNINQYSSKDIELYEKSLSEKNEIILFLQNQIKVKDETIRNLILNITKNES